jgi:hypothetical protein
MNQHQPNKELSTGLYPVKEPTQQEQMAIRDLNASLARDEASLDARVALIEAEAKNRRRMREQKLEGIPQSGEIQTHINRKFEMESAEILRQLQREPESA